MRPVPSYPLGYQNATPASGRGDGHAPGPLRYGALMDVVLIPGFWLDADSWAPVTAALAAAGHRPLPLSPWQLASFDPDRTVGLAAQVSAVVALIDELSGPVALVGHSGGGTIAHGAADQRVERVAHVVYVDTLPPIAGGSINTDLPVVDGKIPLPDWSVFDESDLRDLDEGLRADFAARAHPVPAGVASDPLTLTDPRRHDLPATLIACTFSAAQLHDLIAEGRPFVAEAAAMRHLDVVELPTSHWPQLTRPAPLAAAVTAALSPS